MCGQSLEVSSVEQCGHCIREVEPGATVSGRTEGTERTEKIHKRRNGVNGDETEKTAGRTANNEGSGADRRSAPCGCGRTADASTTRTSGVRVCRPAAPTPPRYARREPARLLRFVSVLSVPPFVNSVPFATSVASTGHPVGGTVLCGHPVEVRLSPSRRVVVGQDGEEPASNDAEKRTQRDRLGGDSLDTAWGRDIRAVRRPQRRVARPTAAISATRATPRSIRSTATTSTTSKSRGGSRPTASARGPSSTSSPRR